MIRYFSDRLIKKIKSSKAFSLSEVLVAILIMSLSAATVAGCIPVAMNVYKSVSKTSNAQVLLSTTLESLRNELGMANDIEISSGRVIKYNAAYIQSGTSKAFRQTTISSIDADGICIEYGNMSQKLVSSDASDEFIVTYESAAFVNSNPKYIIFSDIKVSDAATKEELASCSQYSVKTGE